MAEQTASIKIRVDADVKKQAEAVLNALGISMSTAINLYLRQIAIRHSIPL